MSLSPYCIAIQMKTLAITLASKNQRSVSIVSNAKRIKHIIQGFRQKIFVYFISDFSLDALCKSLFVEQLRCGVMKPASKA